MMEYNSVTQTKWLTIFNEQKRKRGGHNIVWGNQQDLIKHTHYFTNFEK